MLPTCFSFVSLVLTYDEPLIISILSNLGNCLLVLIVEIRIKALIIMKHMQYHMTNVVQNNQNKTIVTL